MHLIRNHLLINHNDVTVNNKIINRWEILFGIAKDEKTKKYLAYWYEFIERNIFDFDEKIVLRVIVYRLKMYCGIDFNIDNYLNSKYIANDIINSERDTVRDLEMYYVQIMEKILSNK